MELLGWGLGYVAHRGKEWGWGVTPVCRFGVGVSGFVVYGVKGPRLRVWGSPLVKPASQLCPSCRQSLSRYT